MEILVHVSAPSSARDDARYRAQVAAICAFEPVSRQSLISDDHDGVPALPPGDAPKSVEHAEPAGPSLLLQAPELISAPFSASPQSAKDATAAVVGQEIGAWQTSTDSLYDRDLKDQRRKKPPGDHPSPCAGGCPQSEPGATGIVTATAPDTAPTNSNPRPCRRHDLQPIFPSTETNHIRPSAPVPAPIPADQSHEFQRQVGLGDQPQPAPDSLGSVISVIPDSQPELSTSIAQPCHRITRSPPPLHEEEDPGRSAKRQRVEARPAMGQTISVAAAPESTITLHSAHHTKKALPRDKIASAPLKQGLHTHVQNPLSADPVVSLTGTRHDHHQHQHQHASSRDDPSLQHRHHFHLIDFLSTLPLTLQPPPPPISTSTFTTHITPTLAMLTERLKPTRTYKPTHQTRELDKLERGYWVMRINITPTKPGPEAAPAQEQDQEQINSKNISGAGTGTGSSPSPQTWSEAEFTRFWTFLCDFIAKDARAGWGVWCIVDHIEPHLVNPKDTNTNINPNLTTAEDALIPILLKVYAWGEVAMHIYLMLYLASDRQVRGMGLRWIDSWEKVVIQMP